jgi:hypothetical protein
VGELRGDEELALEPGEVGQDLGELPDVRVGRRERRDIDRISALLAAENERVARVL